MNPKTNEPVTLINVGKLKMVTNTIKTVIQANKTDNFMLDKMEEPLFTLLSELPGI
jgi:hypothetical protein